MANMVWYIFTIFPFLSFKVWPSDFSVQCPWLCSTARFKLSTRVDLIHKFLAELARLFVNSEKATSVRHEMLSTTARFLVWTGTRIRYSLLVDNAIHNISSTTDHFTMNSQKEFSACCKISITILLLAVWFEQGTRFRYWVLVMQFTNFEHNCSPFGLNSGRAIVARISLLVVYPTETPTLPTTTVSF